MAANADGWLVALRIATYRSRARTSSSRRSARRLQVHRPWQGRQSERKGVRLHLAPCRPHHHRRNQRHIRRVLRRAESHHDPARGAPKRRSKASWRDSGMRRPGSWCPSSRQSRARVFDLGLEASEKTTAQVLADVAENLNLPGVHQGRIAGPADAWHSRRDIVWDSSDEAVIGADGLVTRPNAGEGDRIVMLTAQSSVERPDPHRRPFR